MNVIAPLEYEVAYYDSAVHRFNHYTTRTPPCYLENSIEKMKACSTQRFILFSIFVVISLEINSRHNFGNKFFIIHNTHKKRYQWCYSGLEVSVFKLQSRYCIHFQINTFENTFAYTFKLILLKILLHTLSN